MLIEGGAMERNATLPSLINKSSFKKRKFANTVSPLKQKGKVVSSRGSEISLALGIPTPRRFVDSNQISVRCFSVHI